MRPVDLRQYYKWLPSLYDEYEEHAPKHNSRLGPTAELLNVQLTAPVNIRPYRPGLAPRLGLVELLQVISGYFDERHLARVAPNLTYRYGLEHAYGIKIAQQIPNVVEQLRENPETRRAIIYIGKPEDGYEVEKPCIQSVQFSIRQNYLVSTWFVRSWDMLSGMPYDVVVMGGLTQMIANLAGVHPFGVAVNATSFHLYLDRYDHSRKNFNGKYKAGTNPLDWNTFRVPRFSEFDLYRAWAIDTLNGSLDLEEMKIYE